MQNEGQRCQKWRSMYRSEVSSSQDVEDIVEQFCQHKKIHIPLAHGNGTLSHVAVMMLDADRMLVGRHLHGALIIEKAEDIKLLEQSCENALKLESADCPGFTDLIEKLYNHRQDKEHPVGIKLHYAKTTFLLGGQQRNAYMVDDMMASFAPYKGWYLMPSVYVAIVGVGSWMTPGSLPLKAYMDDYIADKTGLWAFSEKEQSLYMTKLKALQAM